VRRASGLCCRHVGPLGAAGGATGADSGRPR